MAGYSRRGSVLLRVLPPLFAAWSVAPALFAADENRATAQPVGCGIASLAILSRLATGDLDVREPKTELPQDQAAPEHSMLEIRTHAQRLGLELTGVKCKLEELEQCDVSAIALVKAKADGADHFLVVDRVTESHVRVFDRRLTPVTQPRADFEKRFTGFALVPTEAVGSAADRHRVWADDYVIDVGEVAPNAVVARTFFLHANTEWPVTVLDARACCGTTVELASGSGEIAPGRQNAVKVTCRAPSAGAALDRTVSLLTNLPRWPVINLTITGTVVEPVTAVPQVVDFGRVAKRAKVKKQIRLLNLSSGQAQATSFSCSAEFLRVEKVDYETDTSTLVIAIALDAADLRGRLKEKVTACVGFGDYTAEIPIPVTAQVAARISVSPAQLMLGLVRSGVVTTSKVELVCEKQGGFAIVDVKSPPGVAVHWTATERGYELEASVGPTIGFDILEGYAIITTDIPDDSEIRIPIYAAVEPE